jgi:hypothetical protein
LERSRKRDFQDGGGRTGDSFYDVDTLGVAASVQDGGGKDLLIGGTGPALCAIMPEWTSFRDYATRTANISGTGSGSSFDARQNANFFLTTQEAQPTVSDDATKDTLTGSSDQDWFFANLDTGILDKITDLSASEFAEDLDFILSE